MTYGKAIADARKSKQLSQKQLAAMILKDDGIAISPQYLNDIERNRRNPASEHLIAQFAHVLEVPDEYLYFLAHQIPPKYLEVAPSSPEQVQEAFEAFARSYSRSRGSRGK